MGLVVVQRTGGLPAVVPVARGGTNSSTALNNNRLIVSSAGAIVEAAALTNGQLLIGSTGAAPVAAALTAGSGISITNGGGTITIAASGGSGDVVGPAASVDNALVRFNSTTGKLIQDYSSLPPIATDDGVVYVSNKLEISLAHSNATSVAFKIGNITLAGSVQYGMVVDPLFSVEATGAMTAYIQGTVTPSTALTTYTGMKIDQPTMGGGATIEAQVGLHIAEPTLGSVSNFALVVAGGIAQFGGTVQFNGNATIASSGTFTMVDLANFVMGTTNGTKIGTATNQKIGFWNATPVVRPSAYTPTNVSTDRAYDADATTVDELADVLGTLIADLQSIGLIG